MLLAIYLLILLAYASVTEAVPEASCVDTTDPISSTSTDRTKYCSVIQSKLNVANNQDDAAEFNRVFNRNCGPGTATSQWSYFPGNCTCTCGMEFTGPTDNSTPASTCLPPTLSPTASPTASPTPSPTPSPTASPTPSPTASPTATPCLNTPLNDSTFRTALALWFSDPSSATNTYGNIEDW